MSKINLNQLSIPRLGTSTVGSTSKPIYLNNGSPVACSNVATTSTATTSSNGLLSSTDKGKIDNELKADRALSSNPSSVYITTDYKKTFYTNVLNNVITLYIYNPENYPSTTNRQWFPGQKVEYYFTYKGTSTLSVQVATSSASSYVPSTNMITNGMPARCSAEGTVKIEIVYDGTNWIITNCGGADQLNNSITIWGKTFNGRSDITGTITTGSILPSRDDAYNIGASTSRYGRLHLISGITISQAQNGYENIKSKGLQVMTNASGVGIDISGDSNSGCYIKLRRTDISGDVWENANCVIYIDTKSNLKTDSPGGLVISGGDVIINKKLHIGSNSFVNSSLYNFEVNGPAYIPDLQSNKITTSTISGDAVEVGRSDDSIAGRILFKRGGANYIMCDKEGGYYIFTTNGRDGNAANAVMILSSDNKVGIGQHPNSGYSDLLQVNGNIRCSTLTGSVSSDRTLKENLEEKDNLSRINSLGEVVDYNYTKEARETHEGLDNKKHIGLIYQNVKDSDIPNLSAQDDDGHGFVNYYSPDLIATMIGAIQQLGKKIESLEEKIKELESK